MRLTGTRQPRRELPPQSKLIQLLQPLFDTIAAFSAGQEELLAQAYEISDLQPEFKTIYEEEDQEEGPQSAEKSIKAATMLIKKLQRKQDTLARIYKKQLKTLALELKKISEQYQKMSLVNNELLDRKSEEADKKTILGLEGRIEELLKANSDLRSKNAGLSKQLAGTQEKVRAKAEVKCCHLSCPSEQQQKLGRAQTENTRLRGQISLLKSQIASMREKQEWTAIQYKGSFEKVDVLEIKLQAKEKECQLLQQKLRQSEERVGEFQKRRDSSESQGKEMQRLKGLYKQALEKNEKLTRQNLLLSNEAVQSGLLRSELQKNNQVLKAADQKIRRGDQLIKRLTQQHAEKLSEFQSLLKDKNRTIIELRKGGAGYALQRQKENRA